MQISVLQNKKNLDKCESVRNGMLAACNTNKYNQLGFLDADLLTPLIEFVTHTNFLTKEINTLVYECPLNEWQEVEGSKIKWQDSFKIPLELLRIKINN